ncbi:MAG: DEAD/DEAH box helicase family protein, partial [Erysipelotrichales bacterium]|nr:DEAD/DEAH box helicase family protein [Erysipelotrichales bacterium]
MGFRNIENIKREYRSFRNDVVTEFYTPVLKNAVLYKRAVGFFSSTALIELSKGISGLIKNGGKIKFIVSPILQEDDIEAISKGYEIKDVVENCIVREFYEPQSKSDEERLNWLATLIGNGYMDIKVAFTASISSTGMYHEKMGVIYDDEYNKIAFSGSMNETLNAFVNNYESIDVYCSWYDYDKDRVYDKETAFDLLWNNKEENIKVIEFPKAAKEKLKSYKKESINLEIDDEFIKPKESYIENVPAIPAGVKLHAYQNDAISKWKEFDYRGIFDMATGTGKTYTGLGAATQLYNDKEKVAIIIVCPYQHLVEQWVEDIKLFNLEPIVGYSSSNQKDWKQRLTDDILDFTIGVIKCFCFVTTNATFSSDYVKKMVDKLGKDTLLIVDEAHNFGAYNLSLSLNPKIEYRLALSATLERHGDEDGTKILYDYFGDKCIEYGLERAIKEDKLTPYYYYPKPVYLTEEELEKYRELSKKIAKCCHKNKKGKLDITEQGKKLLIERSRLVAGASNKIELLKELMQGYRDKTHILIYCGATRIYNPDQDFSEVDTEGERQIVAVSKLLGKELGMVVTHFTS